MWLTALFFPQSDDVINTLIKELSSKFILQDEGDVSAFLGVQISKNSSIKAITLTPPGLIQQVRNDVGMTKFTKGRDTPVDSILCADPSGAEQKESWSCKMRILTTLPGEK